MPYPRRLLWDILPRNTPNSQNLLLRCPPTDFSLGGYGILPYPRRLLWDILPRNTPNSQNLLLRCPPTDFTDLHRCEGAFKGVHLSQVHQPSNRCQPSKKCTNQAIGTICFVGAVLALASGKAERRQLHPLGWQRGYGRDAIPSYICAHPCSSVGGSSLQEVL